MSAANTGTPCADSCSAMSWSVLVLPVPGRAGDQAVPGEHADRDPDADVRPRGLVHDQRTELDDRRVERVAGCDLGRRVAVGLGSSAGIRTSARRCTAVARCRTGAARVVGSLVPARSTLSAVIFKRVGDTRPYPDHGTTLKQWADVPPRQVRLDELVTTKTHARPGHPARRGLDVLRRPVRPRRGVAGPALPRGRAAPSAAYRASAAQLHARPRARARRREGRGVGHEHRRWSGASAGGSTCARRSPAWCSC